MDFIDLKTFPLPKAIIFDMDGTLVDSEPVFTKVWNTVAQKRGRVYTLAMKRRLMGQADLLNSLKSVLDEWGLEEDPHVFLGELNTLYMNVLPKALVPMRGVYELLDLLAELGIRKAMSTSSPRIWAEHVLNTMNFGQPFENVTTADEVVIGKPEPEAFEIPLRALGLSPEEAIAIEDSPVGVTSAKAAGLYTIAIKSPFIDRADVAHADHYIDGLHQINRDFLLNLKR